MKNRPLIFLLFVAFAVLSVSLVDAQERPIRIGAIASLSGQAAEQGRNWLSGAILAAEELGKAGTEVVLKVEDDATRPASVPLVFEKLVSVDKVQAVIGGTWDFLAEAAYPMAEKLKTPFITPTNPIEIFSQPALKNHWVFTNGLSIHATEIAVERLMRALRPKSAVVIVPNVPFGVAHSDMMRPLLESLGIALIFEERYDYAGYHETLKLLAQKAKARAAEAIFCLTDYVALDIFAGELQRLHYRPWLITTQHLDEALTLAKQPERFAKAFGIYPAIVTPEFAERYSKRFGSQPKVYSAEGYDALGFIVKALRSKVDFALGASLTYDGITGTLQMKPGSRSLVDIPAAVKGVENGRLVDFGAVGLSPAN